MNIMTRHSSNRMRTAALALCAFAVATTPIWAQAPDAPPPPPQNDGGAPPPHPHGNHAGDRHVEMMAKHLNLSTDQVTQVKAIDKDGMTQMRALHEDTSIPQADKHEKMKALHEAQQAKIRAILTEEQKPKFDAMVAREHERMEEHRDHDAPPPPPPAM